MNTFRQVGVIFIGALLLISCASGPAQGPSSAVPYNPGEIISDCSFCPEMVVMPTGVFTMGKGEKPLARPSPAHKVKISNIFAVGKFEITFKEWDACVSAGGCGGYTPDDKGWGRGDFPVTNVNWNDANAYVTWLSKYTGRRYRLLSEAEWEFAARGGSETLYPNGDDWRKACEIGNIGSTVCIGKLKPGPAPVGSFPANGFGVHDTVGNVNEWVEDCWHENYEGAPSHQRPWLKDGDCSRRVFRSGSWNNTRYFNVTSIARWGVQTDYRGANANVGFRVALDLD